MSPVLITAATGPPPDRRPTRHAYGIIGIPNDQSYSSYFYYILVISIAASDSKIDRLQFNVMVEYKITSVR